MSQKGRLPTEEEIIKKCRLSPKTTELLRDMSEETYKEVAREVIFLAKPIIVAQALRDVGEWLEKNSISATTALISVDPDVIEVLKQGEMPKEIK